MMTFFTSFITNSIQRWRQLPISGLIICVASADVFLLWPQIDLHVTQLFYDPISGFILRGVWWERLIYHSIGAVLIATLFAIGALWYCNESRRCGSRWQPTIRQLFPGATPPRLAALCALLIIVPGLIVNAGFKEHWGRARPIETVQFGGSARFTPAFIPSDQGGGSFSSGHAAAAFYLITVAVTLRASQRRWLIAAIIYAALTAGLRIASGSHFMSDVFTSGMLVWLGWWVFIPPLTLPTARVTP